MVKFSQVWIYTICSALFQAVEFGIWYLIISYIYNFWYLEIAQ